MVKTTSLWRKRYTPVSFSCVCNCLCVCVSLFVVVVVVVVVCNVLLAFDAGLPDSVYLFSLKDVVLTM